MQMSTKKDCKSNFQEIIDRLRQVSGLTNEYEIAELLGFKKDSFAARKSRGSLPKKEIELACASHGWSHEWIMTGKGEMQTQPGVAEEQGGYTKQSLTEDETYLICTFRKLHPAERDKVIEIAELYSGVKEPRRSDGGGKGSKESNSN